jgi:tetratricopeptide (TPR) repeat protein
MAFSSTFRLFASQKVIFHRTAIRREKNAKGVRIRTILAAFCLSGMLSLAAGCGGITAASKNTEGLQLYQQARYTDALREFQEASYADPSNADALYNMAATYHRIGKQYNSPADLRMAEDYYNRCLDKNESHTPCYRGLAVLLAEEGRQPEAFHLLQNWAMKQPNSADARVEIARLSEEVGDKNAAKEYLIEALAKQSDNPRALTALAKLQEDSGNYQQALVNYQRSLQADSRQTQVATRITALQNGVAPSSFYTPGENTMTAETSSPTRRY